MGAARNHQDPDERRRFLPKLIMAGRLAATVDGRPVVIEADDAGIKLAVRGVRAAWAARKSVAALLSVLRVLKFAGVPVKFELAGIVTFEVLPQPSVVARILVPGLSSLA